MQIDSTNIDKLDFEKSPMIPTIVQDQRTGQVLMQGFSNLDAVKKTLECGKVTFYSRSKDRLWTKGETSENYLEVVSIHTDCDYDSILILANPKGPTCHLGVASCFGDAASDLEFIGTLNQVIEQRREDDPSKSYTASLFAKDLSRSCQKVGEEGVEVALAAMKSDNEELLNESADLLYHLLVLLKRQNLDISDVVETLKGRHK